MARTTAHLDTSPRPFALPARRRRPWLRQALEAYAFLGPALLILLVFLVLPVVAAIAFSFTDYSIIRPTRWVGLGNYERLLQDDVFHRSVLNTAYYAVGTTFPSMAIGLLLAVALNAQIRGRVLFRTAFYIPTLTSLVAASMIWLWIYNPEVGLLNAALDRIGIVGPRWLADEHLAMPALIAMGVWRAFGFHMLLYLAGLQGIPPDLYDAAYVDGATPYRTFWHITLPLLRPVSFFLVVTSMISSFQVFGAIYVMTEGGPVNSTTTVVHQIFVNAFEFTRMGYASAMSLVLFAVIMLVTLVNNRLFRSDVQF